MIPNAKKFQKGVSGNPGGRPKGIAALAREHKDTAIQTLVEGMKAKDPRVRIMAAREILDRGFGKPLTMTADVSNRLEEFDDEALDAAINAIRAAVSNPEPAAGRKGSETEH